MPLTKYHYDGLNRLVREDNYLSAEAYTWTYDVGGNITEKKTYTLSGDINLGQVKSTASYTYGNTVWKDQLTAYNGQTITYDALGNPTEYKGNELDWTRMRQLASYGSNTFEYGADGIRCKKNNITYALNGSRILKEIRGTVSLTYYYGLSGIIGFQYDAEDYFYQKNLQGDITAIYNSYGGLVAEYKYDAWGKVLAVVNHTSANIGDLNPFRYRGYYYDTETDLYYLQTRYYDPETGRFINADDLAYLGADESLSSYNLYAYCANNPVMGCDPTGHWDWGGVIAGLGIIACVAITVATFGVGSPLGAVVAAAAITTGAVMTYAAATDSQMVIDLSVSIPFLPAHSLKLGLSFVIDFKNDEVNMYPHVGWSFGAGNGMLPYSVGLVENYNCPEDYAGAFFDINMGINAGLDHCWGPEKNSTNTTTKATSITFGQGISASIGYDHYFDPIRLFGW